MLNRFVANAVWPNALNQNVLHKLYWRRSSFMRIYLTVDQRKINRQTLCLQMFVRCVQPIRPSYPLFTPSCTCVAFRLINWPKCSVHTSPCLPMEKKASSPRRTCTIYGNSRPIYLCWFLSLSICAIWIFTIKWFSDRQFSDCACTGIDCVGFRIGKIIPRFHQSFLMKKRAFKHRRE